MGAVTEQMVRGAGYRSPLAAQVKAEPAGAGEPLETAFVARRSVLRPSLTAPMRNVRPVEAIHEHGPTTPFEPIRYGETPCRPARMPIFTSLNIAGIHAVMRDTFWLNIWRSSPIASTPGRGGQQAWREKVNIRRRDSEAYGSQFVLDPEHPGGLTGRPMYAGVPG